MDNAKQITTVLPWSEGSVNVLGNLSHHRLISVSDGTATINIDHDIVESGFLQKLTRVCVINETSDYTKLRIGIITSGIFHPHEEQYSPSAGKLYWSAAPFFLAEGDQLRIEFTDTTNADRLVAYLEQFEVKVRK